MHYYFISFRLGHCEDEGIRYETKSFTAESKKPLTADDAIEKFKPGAKPADIGGFGVDELWFELLNMDELLEADWQQLAQRFDSL